MSSRVSSRRIYRPDADWHGSILFAVAVLAGLFWIGCSDIGDPPTEPHDGDSGSNGEVVSFRDDVIPIFNTRGCIGCHGRSGGLSVATPADLLAGGNLGPAVVPDSSSRSILTKALRGQDGIPLMPLGASEPIPEEEILLIAKWIDQGAKDN